MIVNYQVTLFCTTGQYKPVSCIVKHTQNNNSDLTTDKEEKRKIINEGIKKICAKRYWTKQDFLNGHYGKAKIRIYDKAKIEAEDKARYEAIKE